jgi:membrane protein involved in colicin uptake
MEYVEGLRKKAEEKRAEEALARLKAEEEAKKRAEEEKRMMELAKKRAEGRASDKIKKFIKEKNEKSRVTSVFKELDFLESTPKKTRSRTKVFVDIGDGMSLAKKDPRGRKPLISS